MTRPAPLVSIIVVPRERFDYTEESLASLYAQTPEPFELIYVDNALPAVARRALAREAAARGFAVVRAPWPMAPNEARNLGFSRARGRYALFVDNDVVFDDGWLSALLACMTEEKATVAAPLVCQHGPHHTIVHCAGGAYMGEDQLRVFRQQPLPEPGRTPEPRFCMQEEIFLQDHPVAAVGTARRRVGFVEFHCLMIDAEFLRRVGGLDPKMTATKEYVDLAMTVERSGGTIWLEPGSRVTFLTHPPTPVLKLSEAPYFMLRWSDAWERDSLKHFAAKWDLVEDRYFTDRYDRLGWRRRSELITPVSQLFRFLGKPARKRIKAWLVALEKPLNAWLTRRHAARVARLSRRMGGA